MTVRWWGCQLYRQDIRMGYDCHVYEESGICIGKFPIIGFWNYVLNVQMTTTVVHDMDTNDATVRTL